MVTDMHDTGQNDTRQERQNEDDRRGEILGLKRTIHELSTIVNGMRSTQDQMKIEQKDHFNKVFHQLNRIASQPGRRTRVADDHGRNTDHEPPHETARLSRCPKTLHLLWDEWTNGISGNKPARLFTIRERGRSKHVFSKRKVFWNKVSELVRSGEMASSAIDKIYDVYGDESVTTILRMLANDKKIGGNPLLRV
mmetsp:Transcript_95008/g.264004  ORF Transcript_95008/g.264004 Transcript_95008/m.264004 type:complete len:195 (-) Transcript_95008:29-613(-)